MLYEFLYPLKDLYDFLSWLRVLRYLPVRAIGAWLTSMVLFFWLYPWFIKRLQYRQIGQVIREDGPSSHFSKLGTPTMGGSLLLLVIIVSTVTWTILSNYFVWIVLTVTVLYGGIGFIDDYRKIKYGSAKGLAGRWKLLFQYGIALGIATFIYYSGFLPYEWEAIKDRISIPFLAFEKHPIVLPLWFHLLFASTVIVATSNAVNITDGLDGLAIGPVMINSATYMLLAYLGGATFYKISIAHYLDIPYIPPASELVVFSASVIGAGFGFLWYNTFPAQVFMGDVGSLSLGGALGTCAVLTKNELLSVILGGIFVIEALSVIIQVVSYKTCRKRVFKMAPIHHHFELRGWPEPKIIVRFWIVSIVLALISLVQLKLR